MDEYGNPSAQELLDIIERARAEREAREAMDRYWRAVVAAIPKASDWPCTESRKCVATHHQRECPTRVAEIIKKEKK